MKTIGRFLIALLVTGSVTILFASDSLEEEGTKDRMFEKDVKYKDAKHHHNDYKASPFYIGKTMDGVKTPPMMKKTQQGEWYPYRTSYLDKPVEIGDEIAIVRTSTTKHTIIKSSYDKKGNIISIHAWDRRKGQDLKISLDVLAEPIIKDEIESTVAKLRIVYNSYGEVISKAAWNKVTGEKIASPAAIPFTNYINEDKYWAFVERQKLYERSYEDMYVDRGAVRTKRMRKMVRYGNPFGVPEEIEVYEERPIVERHFEDAHYENDGHIAIIAADMDGSISDGVNRATIGKSSGTYLEAGFDVDLFRHAISFRFLNLDNQSTITGQLQGFDSQNFNTGAVFDQSVSDFDFTYRREWVRSERGEFGINWLFSLKYLDFDLSLANGGTTASINGPVVLPTFGAEMIKNMSDHIDLIAQAKVFSYSDTSLTEYDLGAKYYFRPENVDDWRLSLGLKGYALDAKSDDDEVDIEHSGYRIALERGF
tara:strand:+ start:47 stop:1489 length:1443 start_codon:yes stop_codon:yes gene_type:complete